MRAGELPLEIIRMKLSSCNINLRHNEPGFTLPSNIGELGDDIVNLDLRQCSLQGITCRVAPGIRTRENERTRGARNWGTRNESKCS